MSLRSSSIAHSMVFAWVTFFFGTTSLGEQETEAALSDVTVKITFRHVGGLVDFSRDVRPIFAEKCLKCHGPDEAKNDFRVDDSESVLSYVEPEDSEGSSLWVDYLVTDDPEMRMPPPTENPADSLSGAQLATIKLWIEEGAEWEDEEVIVIEPISPAPVSLAGRTWAFQGIFHPATVHFPIALLAVSSCFVLLSFFRRETCEPVAFHCLWIGALGAILASLSGWAYATHEGYGGGFSFDLQNSLIDRHRWLGIAVAALALILIPMAIYVRRTGDLGMRLMWLVGSLFLISGVSLAGYQGGELTYGEGHYEKEFERFFPAATTAADSSEEEPIVEGEPTEVESSSVDEEPIEVESSSEEAEEEEAPIGPDEDPLDSQPAGEGDEENPE